MHKAFEEILEAIWSAGEEGHQGRAQIQAHCPIEVRDEVLNVLERQELIRLDGEDVELTAEGREKARGVVRRHRLATTLFATILNMDADKREALACEVEHTLLPEVEEGICTLLGHPETSPDNKPIPPGQCCTTHRTTASTVIVNLTTLAPGEHGRITYIKPKHHTRLHKLTSFGLTPGTVVEVHQRSPAFCIRYEGTEIALNRDVAEDIFVARMSRDQTS